MITLTEAMQAAQDSQSRHPLVEIKSAPLTPDIPFDGVVFSPASTHELHPFVFNHSSSITIVLYASDNNIVFNSTNADGTQFTNLDLLTPTVVSRTGITACELVSGLIGILWFEGTYVLKSMIVDVEGTVVTAPATIASWSSTIGSHISVVYDTVAELYYMVYAKTATGPEYYLYKRTSANFLSWSAESAITIPDLDVEYKIGSPFIQIMDTGDWWLWFDYITYISPEAYEVGNIFYSVSSNQGSTWSAATALTNQTEPGSTMSHPSPVQQTTIDNRMAYTRTQDRLMNQQMAGDFKSVSYDPLGDKVYILASQVIYEVDRSDWTVERTWNTSSVPALTAAGYLTPIISNGKRYQVHPFYATICGMDILDTDANTIRSLYFKDVPASSIVKNVTFTGTYGADVSDNLSAVYVDEDNMRVYMIHSSTIGYIDMTQAGPAYTYVGIVNTAEWEWYQGPVGFQVDAASDRFIVSVNGSYLSGNVGSIHTYSLSTGGLVASDTRSTTNFPYRGPGGTMYYGDGYIYSGIVYTTEYGQEDYRGLMRINTATGLIDYFQPAVPIVDDFGFHRVTKGKGDTIVIASAYGLKIFDTFHHTWEYRDVVGSTTGEHNSWQFGVYDDDHECIYGVTDYYFANSIVFNMPWIGAYKTSQYQDGVLSGGTWTFTDKGELVQGLNEWDAVIIQSPVNASMMLAFWEYKQTEGVYRVKWDQASPIYDVTPYIVDETEITIEKDITNSPNKLTFTAGQGHLFDPHNSLSVLSGVLKKGRKLTVRWGETISGVDNWQNAGTFIITETKVAYERGTYTDIDVTAEDMRITWPDEYIFATTTFVDTPEEILEDVLTTHGGLDVSNIDIPAMDTSVELEHQWLDTTLETVVEQICDRFGYFPKITNDDTFTIGKISDASTVNHVYSDQSKLLRFEPEDKYSDFTNRVTVLGQSRTFTTVTYSEELVGTLNGTEGCFGANNEYTIRYSSDESKVCINPRLHIVSTQKSLGFEVARLSPLTGFEEQRISQSICRVDPLNRYCVVKVDVPDLTAPLIEGAVIELVASFVIPDGVMMYGTIRVGSLLTGIMMMMVSAMLSAQYSYQYEIYARPQGQVRSSCQAVENDTAHQAEIGRVVERKIEDPLCYTSSDCYVVAAFELLICKLQRKRVKINKIAHLQDEEGDTITVYHPYTGLELTMIIAKLSRRFQKSASEDGEGYFVDDIEGWII